MNTLREGEVYSGRGNNNEYLEYEIRRDSLSGRYDFISHDFLSDSYGNSAGITTDVQESASTLEELRKKIKAGGYIINR